MFAILAASILLAPPATTPTRLPPRAESTPGEYTAQAAELRRAYAKPPQDWPKPNIDAGVDFVELGRLPAVEHPKDNPYSKEKAELGLMLFFDPRLSGSRQIACASCHDPDLAWADGRTASFGHGRTLLKRNAPAVQFSAFFPKLFWDGRAESLEDQAVAVFLNPDEMKGTKLDIEAKMTAIPEYRERFVAAFGSSSITLERIGQAVAAYERSLAGGRSRFDAFLGGKTDALTDAEVRGLHLFRTDARCANCHHGPLFSDGKFHDIGLSYYGRKYEDLGRYTITGKAEDVGAFKTPSLRNIGRTRPYMHNGLFELDGVLNLYNAGAPTLKKPAQLPDNAPPFPTKSRLLKPLGLNKHDLVDLKAFLLALDEPIRRIRPPELPGLVKK